MVDSRMMYGTINAHDETEPEPMKSEGAEGQNRPSIGTCGQTADTGSLDSGSTTDSSTTSTSVTIRVARFTPRQARPGRTASNPFAASSSPFGSRPGRPRGKRWTQEYKVHTSPEQTILDCLLQIKREQDPTLNFRYSCGHGMCGSDAVLVNSTPTLLCTATIGDHAKAPAQGTDEGADSSQGFRRTGQARDAHPEPQQNTETVRTGWLGIIEIKPLPGFTPLRDLIVDTDTMFEQIRRFHPYLRDDAGPESEVENLQTPVQLSKFELLSNCIACGICEGSCPVYAGGEAFAGPAALIAASRFINDSRDQHRQERLDDINQEDGILACESVRACSRQCPKGIDVGEEMWRLVEEVNR